MMLQVKDLSTFSGQAPKFCLVKSSQCSPVPDRFLFVSVNPRQTQEKYYLTIASNSRYIL